jgi:hypothetical protein
MELLRAYALMRRFRCRGRGTEVHDSEQKEAMYCPDGKKALAAIASKRWRGFTFGSQRVFR